MLSLIPELQAQTSEDTLAYRELDPVVVTGTRFELEKSKVPGTITVVSRDKIERNGHANILPIISNHVPGMLLNNRSLAGFGVGPNSGGNISIRGISGTPNSRILVLIDGQPQFMGIFAHPIADAYSSSDIERAEVVRGASSLLYGSNAMGGAINFITRKSTDEGWQGSGKIGYGSYNTALFSGTLGYKKEKFNTFLSINRTSTDGYRKAGSDEFRNTTGFFRMDYALRPTLNLTGDVQIADAVYFHPGTINFPLENDKREYFRGRAAVSLKNAFQNLKGGLFLYFNWGDHRFAEGFQSNDINRGLTFFQNFKIFQGNKFTVGFDHKSFGGEAQNESIPPPARIGFGEKHKVQESDIYISVQQELGRKITFHGGIRWANNSAYGENWLPSAGINYQVTEDFYLKTLFSTAYRSPAIAELFLFPTSNPDLAPEEVSNYELGINHNFWDRKLEIELVGFINEGKNLIQVTPETVPPVARNSGNFTNKGLEAKVNFIPGEKLDLLLNYSRIDVSQNVLYSPRQMIKLMVNYNFKKFSVSADLQQVLGLRSSQLPDDPLENYHMINLRGKCQVTEFLQLFVEGNNLLDNSYEVEKGYPMPGINFLGGVQVKF